MIHVWLLTKGIGMRGVAWATWNELWAWIQSERLRTIRIRIHAWAKRAREAIGHGPVERRLARWRGPRVKPLRLSVWLALGTKWLREILGLRLALRLLRAL